MRVGRRTHLAGLRGHVSGRTRRRPGRASSTSSTPTRARRSRCSSATPGRRVRRSSVGRNPTNRCDAGNWPLIAPSALAYGERNQLPREMTRDDMDARQRRLRACGRDGRSAADSICSSCTARTVTCSRSFITPLDEPAHRRVRRELREPAALPLEVFAAVRAVWPEHKPMSVRISATDWVDGGITGARCGRDRARVRRRRRRPDRRLRWSDVAAGAQPVYGRMFQTPFSDRIRNELRHRDDGGRQHLRRRPGERDHRRGTRRSRARSRARTWPTRTWTLHAAAQLGYDEQPWPKQYLPGREQYLRTTRRAAQMRRGSGQRGNAMSTGGRHALITGGGRGIGAAIAHRVGRRRCARHAARPRPRGARAARRDLAGERRRAGRRRRRRRCDRRRIGIRAGPRTARRRSRCW